MESAVLRPVMVKAVPSALFFTVTLPSASTANEPSFCTSASSKALRFSAVVAPLLTTTPSVGFRYV